MAGDDHESKSYSCRQWGAGWDSLAFLINVVAANYFATTGADFGICWNEKSQLDGYVVFEHGMFKP